MENNSLGQRISKIRGNLTKAAFARELGIEPAYIGMLESGKSTPSKTLIELMCLKFNKDKHWLLTGEGQMERIEYPISSSEEEDWVKYGRGLDDISAKILLLLKDMPEEARREILRGLEEKKLLRELIEERKKLKDAG